jgi:hypothetical protein
MIALPVFHLELLQDGIGGLLYSLPSTLAAGGLCARGLGFGSATQAGLAGPVPGPAAGPGTCTATASPVTEPTLAVGTRAALPIPGVCCGVIPAPGGTHRQALA